MPPPATCGMPRLPARTPGALRRAQWLFRDGELEGMDNARSGRTVCGHSTSKRVWWSIVSWCVSSREGRNGMRCSKGRRDTSNVTTSALRCYGYVQNCSSLRNAPSNVEDGFGSPPASLLGL